MWWNPGYGPIDWLFSDVGVSAASVSARDPHHNKEDPKQQHSIKLVITAVKTDGYIDELMDWWMEWLVDLLLNCLEVRRGRSVSTP